MCPVNREQLLAESLQRMSAKSSWPLFYRSPFALWLATCHFSMLCRQLVFLDDAIIVINKFYLFVSETLRPYTTPAVVFALLMPCHRLYFVDTKVYWLCYNTFDCRHWMFSWHSRCAPCDEHNALWIHFRVIIITISLQCDTLYRRSWCEMSSGVYLNCLCPRSYVVYLYLLRGTDVLLFSSCLIVSGSAAKCVQQSCRRELFV